MRYFPTVLFAIHFAMTSCAIAQETDKGWTPLFNGENLQGWHTLPGGDWRVLDGTIVGTCDPSEPRHGLLLTDQEYGDFDVRLKFRVLAGNSGFYFRSEKVGGAVGVNGFQAEVDRSYETGGLYETGGRAWVIQPNAEELRKHYTPGEWSHLHISARGGDLAVHVNDYKTVELMNDPGRRKGHFALQLHGGMKMHVEYKEIEIRQHTTEP